MTTIKNDVELENIVNIVVSEVLNGLSNMDFKDTLKSLSVRHQTSKI